MATATLEAIRDRLLSVIEGLTPTTDKTGFRRYRAEGDGEFVPWAEKNPTGCLRRVSARKVQGTDPPSVSNLTTETVRSTIEARIAYPQTHRYGGNAARDRDDVIEQDWKKIKYAISGDGAAARGNFTTATESSYDCTPLPCPPEETERGNGVDFLVIRFICEYTRSTA